MKKVLLMIVYTLLLLFLGITDYNSYTVKAAVDSSTLSFENFDVNDDWIVDMKDLAELGKRYNCSSKSENWSSDYDINKDNIVDIYDLTLIARALGKEQGNTFGNINNFGLIAKKGTYRYYSNQNDNGYLYKMNYNITSITKLNSDNSLYINVIGDWIYYSNFSDNGYLYKIKTDGSGKVRLNTDLTISTNISNGYLYYINRTDNNSIYSINIDGTQKKKLTKDQVSYINVVDNYIYYIDDSDSYSLYRINIDGTDNRKICTGIIEEINIYNGWIYYTNGNDNYCIYRMNLDGTSNTKLNSQESAFINVSKGKIYYGIMLSTMVETAITLDGRPTSCYTNNGGFFVNVVDDSVYFIDDESPVMYVLNPDNTQIPFGSYTISNVPDIFQTVLKGTSYAPPKTVYAVTTGWNGGAINADVTWNSSTVDTSTPGTYTLYGTVEGYPGKAKLTVTVYSGISVSDLNKTRNKGQQLSLPNEVPAVFSDGTTKNLPVHWLGQLSTDTVGNYSIEGIVDGYDKRIKLNLTVVQNDNTPSGQVIAQIGDWVYYLNIWDNNYLYRIKTDGTGKTRLLAEGFYTSINVKDSYIYFAELNSGSIYRMNLDGTNKVKMCDGTTWNMQLDGSYLYFSNSNDERLYKVNVLTNIKTMVIDQPIRQYRVSGDWVYFDNEYFTYGLYKVKTDGTALQLLRKDYLNVNHTILVVNTAVYYTSDSGSGALCKINIDGTGYTVLENGIGGKIFTDNYYIYLSNNKISLDGTKVIHFTTFDGQIKNVIGGWIYFENPAEDNLLYKVRTDGTDVQIVS
ncbi:DUF5050 domain-containing protein [Clostridium omnivorum]|uniref:DUF5050 domain-containing protein n=1 Tax=Clostridium omnivorum TaxID=1604902 RepID=A0ABQ5N8Z0_9CLOT|nr:DUF5050 domain-containing protein [Clostridium sp. E14]GLC31679.1 hypothetical protein bsdE14_30890 [Clostridium sp. E14]